jgi:F-type H+-transporting ATPase subunit gamma
MASRQQIKRRITSVKNTKQITKAMQLVAASKLRRAQDAVQGPREFSRVAREMLTHLRQLSAQDSGFHLYTKRPVKRRLLVVIASDRTLAGAYNVNIIRRLIAELKADREKNIATDIICIGRQVAHAATRIQGLNVIGAYQDFPDKPDANQMRPVLNTVLDRFITNDIDAADVIYTHFTSTVSQDVRLQKLLPAGFEEAEVSSEIEYAEIEPNLDELMQSATVRLLEVQLYQALLDAIASEHSMRMLAMKNATDNAGDIIDDLTLEFNNARQAAITQELAEISGGAEALNNA